MANEHVWAELEDDLQKIRELVLAGENPRSPELSKLIEEIDDHVFRAAWRFLNSERLRRFCRSPNEAAQQWWLRMLASGFKKYDPARAPLCAYAYTILWNECCEGTRDARGRVVMYELFDEHADRSQPLKLKRPGIKEEWGMEFYVAVRRLPFNYRRAILLSCWFLKNSKEAVARCGVCVATYNTWVYQARLRLRAYFKGDDRPRAA